MRLIAVGLAALVLVGARLGSVAPSLVAAPSLTNLQDVDELKGLFNRDAGKIRLVLLVSPT